MLRLLSRCLLLALPFAVWLGWFDWRYSSKLNNEFAVKRHLLEGAKPGVEILALGSSHAFHGILPGELGRPAFNLAAPSQSLYYDVLLARKFAAEMPSLRTVVLPISYFSLESHLDQAPERWRCYYYRRYYGLPHRDRSMAHDARNFSLYFLYGRKPQLSIDTDVSVYFDRHGGLVAKSPFEFPYSIDASATNALVRHHAMMRPENLDGNVRLIAALHDELLRRRVELVLVTPPVSDAYRSGADSTRLSRMQGALERLHREHGVIHRDHWADPRFDRSDFWDADHLNHAGATKFSRLLASELAMPAEVR